MNLPEKTVERLSEYRRTLLDSLGQGKSHIFSHELAALVHNTAVQVRRDMMLMGFTSMQRKGYAIKDLIDAIGELIDTTDGLNVCVIGAGNMGRAIAGYFRGKRSKLNVVANFDIDPEKIGHMIAGVKCYSLDDFARLVDELQISIAILTVPPEHARKTADYVAANGIKGILNFTTVPLNMPPHIYLDEYDMITSLEKIAYFVKNHQG
ncbi:MAG: redox-sensing transcriptional repressor Rex [Bacteroidales bacterium]|nr:redox-sensing transcriptional repressor Rex [Bacteroidales bacterium]